MDDISLTGNGDRYLGLRNYPILISCSQPLAPASPITTGEERSKKKQDKNGGYKTIAPAHMQIPRDDLGKKTGSSWRGGSSLVTTRLGRKIPFYRYYSTDTVYLSEVGTLGR